MCNVYTNAHFIPSFFPEGEKIDLTAPTFFLDLKLKNFLESHLTNDSFLLKFEFEMRSDAGLPDFSWYKHTKTKKVYQMTTNNVYQTAIYYTKWS
jgi:hypothetical protein